MASQIKIKRGLKAQLPRLPIGEMGYCTDTKEMYIGHSEGNLPINNFTATHSKAGTVHTLTGLPVIAGIYTVQFKATADFAEGNTFAGGYTAKPNGEETALPDKAFVVGDIVSVTVDVGGKKLGFKLGGGGSPKFPEGALGIVLFPDAPKNPRTVYRLEEISEGEDSATVEWTYIEIEAISTRGMVLDKLGNFYRGYGNVIKKVSPLLQDVWTFTKHTAIIRDLAIDEHGNVFSGSNDKTMKKINSNGEELWSFSDVDRICAVETDRAGNIYCGNSGFDNLKKISTNGKEIWRVIPSYKDSLGTIVIDSNGYIYAGFFNITKFSPDGEEITSFRVSDMQEALADIAIDRDGYMYISSATIGGGFVKMSPNLGRVWTQGRRDIYSLCLDSQGYLYAGTGNKEIIKYMPSGITIWTYIDHGSPVMNIRLDGNDNIYSGDSVGTTKKWSLTHPVLNKVAYYE